jgi:oxygen-independent coproporphyrinogen-3 oxidase
MDHFAKPDDELAIAQAEGTLHRNFQGYTTHAECDLIAVGVSSISSVSNSYSQNEKTLDGYYAAIDAGKLPIIRGLSLTDDDVLRRTIIQQLSCHFALDFKVIEQQYDIEFTKYFEQELEDFKLMEEDNLLSLSSDRIQVTPAGRMLIRNICMVFDEHLRQQTTKQSFSKVI